jgi:hypothetical protein
MLVEVDGLLDQPESERIDAEVEIRLGPVDGGGYVVQTEDAMRHVSGWITSDARHLEYLTLLHGEVPARLAQGGSTRVENS